MNVSLTFPRRKSSQEPHTHKKERIAGKERFDDEVIPVLETSILEAKAAVKVEVEVKAVIEAAIKREYYSPSINLPLMLHVLFVIVFSCSRLSGRANAALSRPEFSRSKPLSRSRSMSLRSRSSRSRSSCSRLFSLVRYCLSLFAIV